MHNNLSDAFVFFGATGDLAHKKIFPSLQSMIKDGVLDVPVIGVAKSGWNLRAVAGTRPRRHHQVRRRRGRGCLQEAVRADGRTSTATTTTTRLTRSCVAKLGNAQSPTHYLAIPPTMFPVVVKGLAAVGMLQECARDRRKAVRPRPGFGAQAQRRRCTRRFPKTTSSASTTIWAKGRWRTC